MSTTNPESLDWAVIDSTSDVLRGILRTPVRAKLVHAAIKLAAQKNLIGAGVRIVPVTELTAEEYKRYDVANAKVTTDWKNMGRL